MKNLKEKPLPEDIERLINALHRSGPPLGYSLSHEI